VTVSLRRSIMVFVLSWFVGFIYFLRRYFLCRRGD
jgi:hypothetical protein